MPRSLRLTRLQRPLPKPGAEVAQAGHAHRSAENILLDQKAIWTSPLRIKPTDAEWLIPLGVSTVMLIQSDPHTMNHAIHVRPGEQTTADHLSTAGVAALGGISAAGYLWGAINYAPQARETGLLAGQALANSLIVNEAFKAISRRDRPTVNNAAGNFFSSSVSNSSFPSNHAIAAWSMASVIASEYPGWLTRSVVYGLAGTVSVSRVLSNQHFPSDVLVGSATGWLIGRYVYRAHHNWELNPYETAPNQDQPFFRYTTPSPTPATSQAVAASNAAPLAQSVTSLTAAQLPAHDDDLFELDSDMIGSTNVPMDSWIYPGARTARGPGPHPQPERRHPAVDTAGMPPPAPPGRRALLPRLWIQPRPY